MNELVTTPSSVSRKRLSAERFRFPFCLCIGLILFGGCAVDRGGYQPCVGKDPVTKSSQSLGTTSKVYAETLQTSANRHSSPGATTPHGSSENLNSNIKPDLNPTLTMSSYWGSGGSANRTVSIDNEGNIYMAGGTVEPDWPITHGTGHCGGSDVAIAKFSAEGQLLWSTLIGGPSEDYAYVSAVSPTGELFVSGRAGEGFPTTVGAFDRSFNGGIGLGPHDPIDAFVMKLSTDGEIMYSTYIGGNGDDNGRAIHLLPSGKLLVGGGNSTSTDLPTDKGTIPGPVLKPHKGGQKDSWVALVAEDGRSLEFLTYFGPNDDSSKFGDETIRSLGVDDAGNIWIGGTTHGGDMVPTPDAFQSFRGSAPPTGEAYIAKLSPDGKRLVYFSWLGGNRNDEIETEGLSDAEGNFYIAGSTASEDFPTSPGAFQSQLRGGGTGSFDGDGWVAKINSDGTLGFSTLYGGSTVGPEGFFGPAVDSFGNVYCVGRFRSDDLPITNNAFQREKNRKQDVALVAFDPNGKELLYGTFFGGTGVDHGRFIAVDPQSRFLVIIGETNSTDLPLKAPFQKGPSGSFLGKFSLFSH